MESVRLANFKILCMILSNKYVQNVLKECTLANNNINASKYIHSIAQAVVTRTVMAFVYAQGRPPSGMAAIALLVFSQTTLIFWIQSVRSASRANIFLLLKIVVKGIIALTNHFTTTL